MTLSYSQRRRRLIAYGRWEPWVDAEPIRAHVREQMGAGLGWKTLAQLAGVAPNTISRLLYGRPLTTRMRPEIARRILTVRALNEPREAA